MADRHPLVFDHTDGQIHELEVGDSLDLTGSSIIGANLIDVTGSIDVTGTSHFVGAVTTDGDFTMDHLVVNGGTTMTGAASFGSTMTAQGAVHFFDSLTVDGAVEGAASYAISGGTSDDVLLGDGTTTSLSAIGGGGPLDNASDVTVTTPTIGQYLYYDGSGWVNSDLTSTSIDELSDATITSPTVGQYLQYNGSEWVNSYQTSLPINELADVRSISETVGDILAWDGTQYINQQPAASGAVLGAVISSMLTAAQMTAEDSNWQLCDGSSCAGTDYATVTGNTTVPDMRGAFLRGNDPSATRDPDGASRALGSFQNEEFKSHNHAGLFYGAGSNAGVIGSGWADSAVYPSHSTQVAGGAETRPKNISVNYYIRVNR